MLLGEGQRVGNFVIERQLAEGGMGVVYVAHHAVTEARVALKLMRPEIAADAAAAERFLREVKAAARIGHDGIVRVFDAGTTEDGSMYLAMELLQGQTLDALMESGAADRLQLLQLLQQMLDPLCAAHAAGIVHRDLKPENIFLARDSDGRVTPKLLDFGIARDASGKSVTATGMALGTPHYMSPEQASAPSTAGPQADVWSVGVMLYEVLTGRMPFDGETLHAVLIQLATQPPRPLSELSPGLDPALCALVDRCLDKSPSARPADAQALRAEMRELLQRTDVAARLSAPPLTGGELGSLGNTEPTGAMTGGFTDVHAATLASIPGPAPSTSSSPVATGDGAAGAVLTFGQPADPAVGVGSDGPPGAASGAPPDVTVDTPIPGQGRRGPWLVVALLAGAGLIGWSLSLGPASPTPGPAQGDAPLAPGPGPGLAEDRAAPPARTATIVLADAPAPGEADAGVAVATPAADPQEGATGGEPPGDGAEGAGGEDAAGAAPDAADAAARARRAKRAERAERAELEAERKAEAARAEQERAQAAAETQRRAALEAQAAAQASAAAEARQREAVQAKLAEAKRAAEAERAAEAKRAADAKRAAEAEQRKAASKKPPRKPAPLTF